MRPFSPASLRCCRKAFSGTINNPLDNPSSARAATDQPYDDFAAYRPTQHQPMRIEPTGTSPSSTLSPDSLPASMLPAPMPTARAVSIKPTLSSSTRNTSLPKRSRSIWNSAPRNQKYEIPSTVSHSGRTIMKCFVPVTTSENGLRRKGAAAPAGATRVILKLVNNPATATASMTIPIFQAWSLQAVKSREPIEVPSTIATKVVISSSALARERSLSGSISGTMPYFAGLKMVECRARRNSTRSMSSMRVEKKTATASIITKTSNTLMEIKIVRLLMVSARWPEYPEKSRKGTTNTARESGTYSPPVPVVAVT